MIDEPAVFDIEGFVPSDVVHRDGPLDALSSSLDALLHHGTGRQTHIFGPSGAGKTCIARYVLDQLGDERPHIHGTYINCWNHYATSALLYQLAAGVDAVADVRPGAAAHDELLQRVREADDFGYVVVLDEVDQIESPDVLYQLYRMPHVHCIYIANDEQAFFSRLDGRMASRLRTGEIVTLDRYTREELLAILDRRAEAGLAFGATTEASLGRIAELAAGDARLAVETLYQAARKGQARGHASITEADIHDAEPVARSELRQKTLSQLTRHQRILFEALEAAGEPLQMGALESAYRARVSSPRSTKTLRRYLSKLAQYNLVAIEGETSGRTYEAQ
ncbi:Cdc6/Cdc18 family protein [Haloglomus salinum]|uniref:Cdc6/Cdc18 family protein n=1 Tax=Haloglomus salinum TaxID=2962673 RepID=UPI0020CA0424|nr:Cdc6/Cdc18 family protein [Haloglomus salinum]